MKTYEQFCIYKLFEDQLFEDQLFFRCMQALNPAP